MISLFTRYACVGIINTSLHWAVFGTLVATGVSQAFANLIAFCVAVSFSFIANARWTFRQAATPARYLAYLIFMGTMALLSGWGADRTELNPLITLTVFSVFSLVAGFAYSRFVVFQGNS